MMKTMKLILSAILMMMAMCAQAQTIQVMKDGKVVKEYAASEVDSVVVKPYVDRNVYSDAACTQKLFDASKVVTGKTSIAGEAWADYSQYVVRTTTENTVVMKIPFIVYYRGTDGTCKINRESMLWEGTYAAGGINNFDIIILAKQ